MDQALVSEASTDLVDLLMWFDPGGGPQLGVAHRTSPTQGLEDPLGVGHLIS